MVEEIGRRLVGGVWVTNVASEGGGGGGGTVEEITSDDQSVTIVNPNGPVVDLSAGGGSLPFTGWTGDEADPQNVDTQGGNLSASEADGDRVATLSAGGLATDDGAGSTGGYSAGSMLQETPDGIISTDAGATDLVTLTPKAATGVGIRFVNSNGALAALRLNAGVALLHPNNQTEFTAAPTAQEIVDFLVGLGMATQAAP